MTKLIVEQAAELIEFTRNTKPIVDKNMLVQACGNLHHGSKCESPTAKYKKRLAEAQWAIAASAQAALDSTIECIRRDIEEELKALGVDI